MSEEFPSPAAVAGRTKSSSRRSSAIRFLGLLKQPDGNGSTSDDCLDSNSSFPNLLELDESDVVWSSDTLSPNSDPPGTPIPVPSSPEPSSPSPLSSSRRSHPFRPEKSGLSAVLPGENRLSFVQRKTALDPTILSTARNIPPAVPHDSGSRVIGSGASSSSSSGKYHQSAPVNVPMWSASRNSSKNSSQMEFNEEDEEFSDEEMLPPHMLVARSAARSHMSTCSVFEGVGRTLKGRDLRRVRNAVFQKTGFLD